MALVLHLQNLPRLANNLDIREFFHGLEVLPGGVQILGGAQGDAFISFSTDNDLLQALSFDNYTLLGTPVRLFLSKQGDKERVFALRQKDLGSERSPSTEHQLAVPERITSSEIHGVKRSFSDSPSKGLSEHGNDKTLESYSTSEFKRKRNTDSADMQYTQRLHDKNSAEDFRRKARFEQEASHRGITSDSGRQGWNNEDRDQKDYTRPLRSDHSNEMARRSAETSRRMSSDTYRRDTRDTRRDMDSVTVRRDDVRYRDGGKPGGKNGHEMDSTRSRPVVAPGYVQATNVPITATAADMRQFFSGQQIADGGIIMRDSDLGNGTLIAYIKFVNMKDAIRADCICDGFKLHGNIITVKLITQAHLENVLFGLPPKQSDERRIPPSIQSMPGLLPIPTNVPPLRLAVRPHIRELRPVARVTYRYPPGQSTHRPKLHPMLDPIHIEKLEYIKLFRPQGVKMTNAASILMYLFRRKYRACCGVIVSHMATSFAGLDEAIIGFKLNTERDTAEQDRIVRGTYAAYSGLEMLKYLKELSGGKQRMYISDSANTPDRLLSDHERKILTSVHIIEPEKTAKEKIAENELERYASAKFKAEKIESAKTEDAKDRSATQESTKIESLTKEDSKKETTKEIKTKPNNDIKKQSVVKTKEEEKTDGKGTVDKMERDKPIHKYFRFENLSKAITACKIRDRFDDALCSGVKLVQKKDGTVLYAYVTLNNLPTLTESYLKKRFQNVQYSLIDEKEMSLDLWKLDATHEVMESSASGQDVVMTMFISPDEEKTDKDTSPDVESTDQPETFDPSLDDFIVLDSFEVTDDSDGCHEVIDLD